jgi:hypothetical protein
MNRSWHRHAKRGLPILSAALLSAVGLLCNGAFAQSASNEVVVDYDVLNGLPGTVAQPAPQAAPTYAPAPAPYGAAMPPYAPYVMVRPGIYAPMVPGYAPALAAPPSGTPTSAITTLGPNGRPTVPIQLTRPGSSDQQYGETAAGGQVASVTPPDEPEQVPAEVPMLERTPPAPPPAADVEAAPAAPTVETPAPPTDAEVAEETAAPEQPAPEQPAAQQEPEQPAEEPAQQQAAQEPESTPAPSETPPAEGEAAETPEEQPTEEAEAPPEPDNTQPAAPIPQGGIRIVFPTEFNDVPVEANSALDDLAAQMAADESMRIEIKCYASGTTDTESKARRKSLQRCINIRQYLFKKDIRTTRMDVRALGLKSEGQPADRVDIVPANS